MKMEYYSELTHEKDLVKKIYREYEITNYFLIEKAILARIKTIDTIVNYRNNYLSQDNVNLINNISSELYNLYQLLPENKNQLN